MNFGGRHSAGSAEMSWTDQREGLKHPNWDISSVQSVLQNVPESVQVIRL